MPYSVQASEEISIETDIAKCFSFFTDLTNIGSCIPGCEQVTPLDSSTANFKVKVKLGYISRTFELKAKLREVRPSEHLTFFAEGSDAEITGTVDLSSEQNGLVRIRYSIEIRPISVTGKTAISMVGKDLVRKQAEEFASCVKKKLES